MKRICYFIVFFALLSTSEALAQQLVFTRNGMVASDNPLNKHVEYKYKEGISKKDLRSYCIQCLGHPDFFSYKIDDVDDQTIKLCGYLKDNFKGEQFILHITFGEQSVKIAADLLDKDGKNMDFEKCFSRKGKARYTHIKTLKSNVESKIDKIIRSMMEMKTEMKAVMH